MFEIFNRLFKQKCNYSKLLKDNKESFVVIDIETTGLKPENEGITEIAAIKIKGNKVEEYSQLINPGKEIPKRITDLTGISNQMVKNEPNFVKIYSSLKAFIGNNILVGHNINFDMSFINEQCKKNGLAPFNNKQVCTLKISRDLLPGISHKQTELAKYYNIRTDNAHRALGDCKMCLQILFKLCDMETIEKLLEEE